MLGDVEAYIHGKKKALTKSIQAEGASDHTSLGD
jgi:hypothetical protein